MPRAVFPVSCNSYLATCAFPPPSLDSSHTKAFSPRYPPLHLDPFSWNFEPTPLQKMVARDIPTQTPQSILGPNKLDHDDPPFPLVSTTVSFMVYP
ncbi:hypothetical protein NPIL_1081 [Nephila pilipes]|uniref:Uncharacterized protein n=1 Tax=Nephila pilipes TaxID=299642 RepID=A0A8X6IYR2_NEPPI|nr:hypothetical protein NPIL_1081 [Nephila pilipes]